MSQLFLTLLSVPAALIALMVHEISHGYMAYLLGDPTAKNLGRLSFNPLKHIDPIGALCMVFFHFGWAKPVPINTRYFRNPKRDMALTALAGPLSNFILAFLITPVYLIFNKMTGQYNMTGESVFVGYFLLYSTYFFLLLQLVNVGLGLFNLIPLPPLDGSRVLYVFLPTRYYFGIMRYERYIAIGLLIFLWLLNLLGLLPSITGWVTDGMNRFWQLLPIF